MEYSDEDDVRPHQASRGRGRHPSHLKGREIGLFYARRQMERNQITKVWDTLDLPQVKLEQIKKLLNLTTIESVSKSENYNHIKDSSFKRKFLCMIHGDIQDFKARAFTRDPALDQELYDELMRKREESDRYKNMQVFRRNLPSFEKRNEVLDLIEKNQVILVSGETGCGKTTQVAQFILDDYIKKQMGSLCRVVCTQPRRISAVSIADRVADERAEKLGLSVGYHIRLEKKTPRSAGSVTFCTTGVVLKQMELDPYLTQISHLILDEIHERDITSDFLIALIKQIIAKRKDLKVILMSATLNAEKFSAYFNDCAHVNIPGFTYPVEEYYLEDVLQQTGAVLFEDTGGANSKRNSQFKQHLSSSKKDRVYLDFIVPHVNQLRAEGKYGSSVLKQLMNPESEKLNYDLIMALLEKICSETDDTGAILVFLTGFAEISALNTQITESSKFPMNRYLVLPLHSQMPTVNQRQIFDRPPSGVRKIVLSTNIAETSITIDDVVYVIDCGRIKMRNFNPETNTETLFPEWVSLANAKQRKGRAGRVQEGVCYHLFSRAREMTLESYQKPEILRSRLENVILTTKVLRLGLVESFFEKLIDRPDPASVSISLNLLRRLNALDEEENVTPLGYHLAKLPMHPQLGKMLLMGVIFSCLDPILSVAVTLDYRDPFLLPLGKERQADKMRLVLADGCNSDHLLFHKILKEFDEQNSQNFCWRHYLSYNTVVALKKLRREFMTYLHDMDFVSNTDPLCPQWNQNSSNETLIKAVICSGLYPNIILARDHKKGRNILKNPEGGTVQLQLKSVLSKHPLSKCLLVYFLKVRSSAIFIHDATIVQALPVIFFGDHYKEVLEESGEKYISVGNHLNFGCNDETAYIIRELREKLNWFLEYKISHPGVMDWSTETEEIQVLRAVMELITAEEDDDIKYFGTAEYNVPTTSSGSGNYKYGSSGRKRWRGNENNRRFRRR